jgi:hypothetical protein
MSSPTLPSSPRTGRAFARGPAPRTRTRRGTAATALVAVVLAGLSGGAATAAANVAPPDVPSKIAVGAGHKPYLVTGAPPRRAPSWSRTTASPSSPTTAARRRRPRTAAPVVGSRVEVPYTADYVFWKRKG